MKNPILATLNQNRMTQQLSPIKSMMNIVKGSGNPQAMLSQLAQNNPQYKQVMDYVRQNGGDAKAAFYKLAEQRGVNPNEILDMLK